MAEKKISSEELKRVARYEAARFLEQDNVTSVGVGYKIKNNKKTKELCIQFTVGEKVALEFLESEGLEELPKSFNVGGVNVPTDVLVRTYKTSANSTYNAENVNRKTKIDPIFPGASIGHPEISAGTAGCVVYDSVNGKEYMLSNWHVLHGEYGSIGDTIVQPGSYDDNRIEENMAGTLVRSYLGVAGDCAIAKIDQRSIDPRILEIGVKVSKVVDPQLGDKVIKSGRTTSVTRGIVSRIHVTVDLDYGHAGMHQIGGFEYVPDAEHPPANGEVSMGGDSGSAVMIVENGRPTEKIAGLHFAGETGNAPEHALACYASSVFKKLQISPMPPSESVQTGLHGAGYDTNFFSKKCSSPVPVNAAVSGNLLKYNNKKVFDYTHFSLVLDKKRKFAPWVAWNIDGANIKKVSRNGIPFKKDPKLPADAQIGNELYKNNPLDRGHIARRAALCWGSITEAKKANKDSFYFTNMTPQHERFNQSRQAGIWGQLENAIFDGARIEDLRVSVFGGPILNTDDPVYRGVQIPNEFWKVICYVNEDDGELVHHCFVLTQRDLISNIERLNFDDFEVYEVPIHEITSKIGFAFKDLEGVATESIGEQAIRRIKSMDDII